MKKLILVGLFLFLKLSLSAQVDEGSVMGIPITPQLTDLTGTPATVVFQKGSFVFVEDQNTFYYYDGSNWVSILNGNNKNVITNELFFEDTNFYYVSVIVNGTNWMVSRFSKTDLNTEAFSMGTGLQPNDLATITSLIYM